MKFETIDMTPEQARYHLEQTKRLGGQRRIKAPHVEALLQEARLGNFNGENGDTIKIDSKGRVIDGQHRLQMIVRLGEPVRVVVVYGLEFDDVFGTYATASRRSAADELSCRGYTGTNNLAAVAGLFIRIRNGDDANVWSPRYVTPRKVVEVVDECPWIVDCILPVRRIYDKQQVRVFSVATLGSVHAMAMLHDDDIEEMESHLSACTTGLPRYDGDPARAAWRQGATAASAGRKMAPHKYQIALLLRSWTMHLSGQPVSERGVVYRANMAYPSYTPMNCGATA